VKKRQGKLPLWRPLKDWKRHEWAPMKEVWRRAEKVIGSDLRDMQRDLRQDFLDGRLIMGMRLFALGGTETRIILERECWQWLKINYAWSITGWEEIPGWKTEWEAEARKRKWERSALVVRRRELDKHYPAAVTATAIERQPDDEQPTKRRPGPRANWRLPAAAELHRIREKEGRTPTAPELCMFCDKTLGGYPDESEMRALMRFLLGE